MGGGRQSCCFLVKIFHGEKESVKRCVAVMPQPVFAANDRGEFSRSRSKMSQQYDELTVWTAKTNS
jgi:hypothetical protein